MPPKGQHNKSSVGRPQDDEQCRLHPYHSHTGGECNYHPNNQGKKKSSSFTKKKTTKNKEDGHMITDNVINLAVEEEAAAKPPAETLRKCRTASPTTVVLDEEAISSP